MALARNIVSNTTNTISTEDKVIALLTESCEIFMRGSKFHHALSLKLSYMNLHGAKRWHKIQSGEDWDCYEKVAYYLVDMFNNIPKVEVQTPATSETYKEYLMSYLEWETYVVKRLNAISSELIALGYLYESELVTAHIGGVIKEIEKIKRWLDDYELYGGDLKFIKMEDSKLHDKLKKRMGK